MTTMELQALKAKVINNVTQASSAEDLMDMLQAFLHKYAPIVAAPKAVRPYPTYQPGELEQVHEDILAFEAERKAGIPGIPADEAARQLEKEFPWLK